MNKIMIVKLLVKAYFIATLFGSFSHILTAAGMLGLDGWEQGMTPWLIDGMFVIAMIMRSEEFSTRTRRIALRVQVVMGALSLTANVYAATSVGGIFLAGMLVTGMIFGEWLVGQIESAEVENARNAAAEAARIVAEAAAEIAAKKAAAIAKGQATRARNAKTRKTQVKALESMLKA